VGILALHDAAKIKKYVDMIVATVKKIGTQSKIEKNSYSNGQ